MKLMIYGKYNLLAVFFMVITIPQLVSQTSQIRENAPKVFIDCEECDIDHIRTEISFVNFVTESKNSDIHVIIISQPTGSGGQFFTFYLIGQNNFASKSDTITFNTSPDDTFSVIRQKINHYLKLGLVPFMKSSPLAEFLTISFNAPEKDPIPLIDKWRHWVFKLKLDGSAAGQDSYRAYSLNSSVFADKITPDFKTGFYLTYGYSELDYRPDYNYLSQHSAVDFQNMTVFSLNDHWSTGFKVRTFKSTFMNTDLMTSVSPAIEYNVFPYSQATRKQILLNYSIGPQYYNYIDTTYLYNAVEDLLWMHNLSLVSEYIQKWGRIRFTAGYSNFLHDFTLNNLRMIGTLGLRIIKGLEVSFSGSYSIINDQHFLPKTGPTIEDVLLRRRQLPSSYSFRANISISYTFGSIYSNVVNPRFGY